MAEDRPGAILGITTPTRLARAIEGLPRRPPNRRAPAGRSTTNWRSDEQVRRRRPHGRRDRKHVRADWARRSAAGHPRCAVRDRGGSRPTSTCCSPTS